jgi:hypothetical protein
MTGPIGLDYVAVFEIARILGIEVDDALLRKLQVLETEMLRQAYKDDTKFKKRRCRHVDACAMCTKQCSERINS